MFCGFGLLQVAHHVLIERLRRRATRVARCVNTLQRTKVLQCFRFGLEGQRIRLTVCVAFRFVTEGESTVMSSLVVGLWCGAQRLSGGPGHLSTSGLLGLSDCVCLSFACARLSWFVQCVSKRMDVYVALVSVDTRCVSRVTCESSVGCPQFVVALHSLRLATVRTESHLRHAAVRGERLVHSSLSHEHIVASLLLTLCERGVCLHGCVRVHAAVLCFVCFMFCGFGLLQVAHHVLIERLRRRATRVARGASTRCRGRKCCSASGLVWKDSEFISQSVWHFVL
jgi:hypothetical protein